ncbi:MAG: molecular chaperone HtpG [Bernardetiaceae bacterium]|jgi:molecular chaperone HtpG|nr:molecular chaperone HtpG [Bernardetiaceae bacterium]
MQEKGNISIHTENIFPIIKKFLYSDHEIFLRELVANAVDATHKIKSLASSGEFDGEVGDTKISIHIDEAAKTLTIKDRGLGMTAEEIKKYINQIAFSGAKEFMAKYQDNAEAKNLIGQFGLGFYSAFMVAEKVKLITQSWQPNAPAAQWLCDGSTEFEIAPTVKSERGTEVVLYLAPDSEEFLQKARISDILRKYCRFLPFEIEFDGQVINNTQPLWAKNPHDLKDEDYLQFYRELYPFTDDPMFWIHLNVDHPFNLTGILYFPKVKQELMQKNKIQLYQKQVFITDEVKDIVPEFLTLLHGVIDSPDIPLNVSRSFLQADGNVKKISSYVTRKVADKLHDLFKNDREGYQQKWDSMDVFVKWGMISDDKFYERAEKFALLKNTESKYATFEEYKELTQANQVDKDGNTVYLYTNDPDKQDAFIQSARKRSYDVLLLDGPIDSHFLGLLERKLEKTQLKRVDSDIVDKLIAKGEAAALVLSDSEKEKLTQLFKTVSGKETVSVESLPTDELPVTITLPEFMRRMKEMAATSGMGNFYGNLPEQYNVVVNGNHALVGKILASPDAELQQKLAQQAYDLALLSQNLLSGASLTSFIRRSVDMAG